MHISHESQLEEITQGIFATMLGFELTRDNSLPADAPQQIIATIQITGESMDSIVLGLSDGAGAAAAAAMLQLPVTEVTPADERDVAAELVNMIGGNLKSVLPGPCQLSLPTVVAGRDIEIQVSHSELIDDLVFVGQQGKYRVQRYERDDALGK
jgi:chemotaxis protein CheX